MSGRRARVERQAARGLARVLEAVGGAPRLAAALGISPQAVRAWRRVPTARIPAVLAACRGLVAAWELEPDGRPARVQAGEVSHG
jgi:DNA-binding transcriptional regulator YdaS (Cro superfamily)